MSIGPVDRPSRPRPGSPSRRRSLPIPLLESLDRRELLAASPVLMLGAATVDSRSVTVSYAVTTADPSLSFGVYRSATSGFDAGAIPVEATPTAPAVDAAGLPAGAPGVHQVTIPLGGGLPINPKHPYVLVVADPGPATTSEPQTVASFRKESIAIVTHGGLQYSHWKKNGPPWELEMARSLREQGFDKVIAFNWVGVSHSPGAAARQGPILAKKVLDAAAQLPAGDPVDLQFIGHSEGAVVNTQAIVKLEAAATPRIRAGFLDDTLLDPHAANPDFPGRQYSVAHGLLGAIAKVAIDHYQAEARDPLAFIPPEVDAAQVFYQQAPANRDHNQNLGVYNLWGQVPVAGPGDASYFNLTGSGVVHSGKNGVQAWYEHRVVPTLGDGGQAVAASTLTGQLEADPGDAPTATYTGTSAPGSTVYLLSSRPRTGRLEVVGQGAADAEGHWSATTRPLADGQHRMIAEARLPKSRPGDRPPVPTEPLGALTIHARKSG